jgi:hypothetical protein
MPWLYYLLTAATFYVVAFVVPTPSLGPVPSSVVKSVLFVVAHVLLHKTVGPSLGR